MTNVVETAAPEQPPVASDNRDAFIRLAIVLALGVGLAVALKAVAVLVVVLALVAMVMLHELGHFIAAKSSGMQVTEYFFGFGPRIWSVRRGETEYGVKAIPAGGYVRVTGMTTLEEVNPADEMRSYRQASFPRRIAVATAGSAMHALIAFALLWSILTFTGLQVATSAQVSGLTRIDGHASPAMLAGLKAGDLLVAVDGHRYANPNSFISYIRSHPDRRIALVVRRTGHDVTLHLRPVTTATAASPAGQGKIGVDLVFNTRNETTDPIRAIPRAGVLFGQVVGLTATGIAQVFSIHGFVERAHQVATAGQHPSTGKSADASANNDQLLSIVGAIQISAQAAGRNVTELLYILVGINIFVGMVNLFPMLPLDGGHVAIACYERIRSRRGRRYHADVKKLMPVAYLFLAVILVIGLGALYANIVQPVSLPGG